MPRIDFDTWKNRLKADMSNDLEDCSDELLLKLYESRCNAVEYLRRAEAPRSFIDAVATTGYKASVEVRKA